MGSITHRQGIAAAAPAAAFCCAVAAAAAACFAAIAAALLLLVLPLLLLLRYCGSLHLMAPLALFLERHLASPPSFSDADTGGFHKLHCVADGLLTLVCHTVCLGLQALAQPSTAFQA